MAAFAVTAQFPTHAGFEYSFTENQVWQYGDLYAPYDFPIHKPQEVVDKERAALLKNFKPVYIRQTKGTSDKMLLEWQQEFGNLSRQALLNGFVNSADSIRQYNIGRAILRKIAQKGFIERAPEHKTYGGSRSISEIDRGTKKTRQLDSYLSEDLINAYISDELREYPEARNELLSILIPKFTTPNVFYDQAATDSLLQITTSDIVTLIGNVKKGELIIAEGSRISGGDYNKLLAYQQSYAGESKGSQLLVTSGYFLLTALLFMVFGAFAFLFTPEVFKSIRQMVFIALLIVLMLVLVRFVGTISAVSYYVVPFCIVPIVLRTFFGPRLALYAHLLVVLLANLMAPLGVEFAFLHIVAGMVAIFTNIRAQYWSQFFLAIGVVLITYVVGFAGIAMIESGSIIDIDIIDIAWILGNVFLTLLAYPLIPIFAKLVGQVSDITLTELSDLNKPLLKELSTKAPGTFQHSINVANLAEAAANKIKANALLVKVAALYHDIGKIKNPRYFIENNPSGVNPHAELPFDESAKIIINHISDGVELAKKHRLPNTLIDFIKTHHGTTRVEFFYRSYVNANPGIEVDEAAFRYEGPKPSSKETGILMLADTVEAASKSLKSPTLDSIDELVDKLIDFKIEHDQLSESDLTFKEIKIVRAVFKRVLHSVYHVRIEYPEEKN